MDTNAPGHTIPQLQSSLAATADFSRIRTVTSGAVSAALQVPPAGALSKDTLAKLRAVAEDRTLDEFEKGGRTYYGVKKAELSATITDFIRSASKKSVLFRFKILKVLMQAAGRTPTDDAFEWDGFLKNPKLHWLALKGLLGYLSWNTMLLILAAQDFSETLETEDIQSSDARKVVVQSQLRRRGPKTRPDIKDILEVWDGNDGTWNNLWFRHRKFRALCESYKPHESTSVGGTSQRSKRKREEVPSSKSSTDATESDQESEYETDNGKDSQIALGSACRVRIETYDRVRHRTQQRFVRPRQDETPTELVYREGKTALKYLPLGVDILKATHESRLPELKKFFSVWLPFVLEKDNVQRRQDIPDAILGFLAQVRRGKVEKLAKVSEEAFEEFAQQGQEFRREGPDDLVNSDNDKQLVHRWLLRMTDMMWETVAGERASS